MKRPNRPELYLAISQLISHRATCQRGRVGAVITQNNRIVSTGYNGPLHGDAPCETHCFIERPCQRAVHAEANAIASAARLGIALQGATLYCTTAPCRKCAELIFQVGIAKVIYIDNYRNTEGVELLKQRGVDTQQGSITYNFYESIQNNNYI